MSGLGYPIAEEDLHAYVDGYLDGERRAAVESYVQSHPATAMRVEAYALQRDALRAVFADRSSEPLPFQLNLSRLFEEKLRRRRTPWVAIAATIAALAAGGAGGWLLGNRPLGGINALAQEAAASYAVYVVDRHRPVEMSGSQQSDLRRWLSNRLNRPVVFPDLSTVGYEFLGGRLVPSPHGPAAFLMYQSTTGTRMTIYLRSIPGRAPHPIEQVDVGAIDGCAWVDRRIGYFLIAAEPYAKVLELSRFVRQAVRSSG